MARGEFDDCERVLRSERRRDGEKGRRDQPTGSGEALAEDEVDDDDRGDERRGSFAAELPVGMVVFWTWVSFRAGWNFMKNRIILTR